jgi:oligopeptide/dipeptide ABC transporter ATP-binding protein
MSTAVTAVCQLVRRPAGKVGLGLAAVIGLVAVFGPWLATNPNVTDYTHQLASPSQAHWLGTDEAGRDALARSVAGLRTSIGAALTILAITTTAGLGVGAIAGYLGGLADALISRVIDVLLGLPSLILALAIVGALGVGYWNLIAAISFSIWAYIARIARSHVLGSRTRLDVIAARMAGVGEIRNLAVHVLPGAAANVLVASTTNFAEIIASLAGLSFLGLGAQPPSAELGQMLADSRGSLAGAPWLVIGPTLGIVVSVAAATLLSDALRDVVDPRTASVNGRWRWARRRTALEPTTTMDASTDRSGRRRLPNRIAGSEPSATPRATTDRSGRRALPAPGAHSGRRTTPTAAEAADAALVISDLQVTYPDGGRAVRGVSLAIRSGQCLAVVGESGCGKTSVARAVLGILPSGSSVDGSLRVGDAEVLGLGEDDLRRLRGLTIGYVAQDPYTACDPLQRVGRHVIEAWGAHHRRPVEGEPGAQVAALGIDNAAERLGQRPHQWSGGMLQRATIVAANAHNPIVTVADEPTTALDADLADDVIAAVRSASQAVLLISHDLRLVAHHSDEVAVMYAGRIVEAGSTRDVVTRPRHPYTRALLAASPDGDALPVGLSGAPPAPQDPSPGCPFAPRCPVAQPVCADTEPPLEAGVACWASPR